MTGAELLREGAAALAGAGIGGAAGDARRLLADALNVGADRLTLHLPEEVGDDAARRFRSHLAARAGRQPVSRILGRRTFFGRAFRITPDVLDPRPETETLVTLALERPFDRVIDLGTGSSCILTSLLAERPEATGTGTDISAAALSVARENAQSAGIGGRADWLHGDWWEAVAGRFDLIVSNPPYIAAPEMTGLAREVRDHDPEAALCGGADGFAAYRRIAAGLADHAAPGARVLLEIGPGQADVVTGLLTRHGCAAISQHTDFDGRTRVIGGLLP